MYRVWQYNCSNGSRGSRGYNRATELNSAAVYNADTASVHDVDHRLIPDYGKGVQSRYTERSRQLLVLIPCVLILPRIYGAFGLAISQATSDAISFIIAAVFLVPTLRELHKLKKEAIASLCSVLIETLSIDDDLIPCNIECGTEWRRELSDLIHDKKPRV